MHSTIHQDSQVVPVLDEAQPGCNGSLPEVPPAASLALAPDPLQVSSLIPPPIRRPKTGFMRRYKSCGLDGGSRRAFRASVFGFLSDFEFRTSVFGLAGRISRPISFSGHRRSRSVIFGHLGKRNDDHIRLSLPARNKWGESWREGLPEKPTQCDFALRPSHFALRTSDFELRPSVFPTWTLGVRCWLFSLQPSS
jgi:hypothetical protein